VDPSSPDVTKASCDDLETWTHQFDSSEKEMIQDNIGDMLPGGEPDLSETYKRDYYSCIFTGKVGDKEYSRTIKMVHGI